MERFRNLEMSKLKLKNLGKKTVIIFPMTSELLEFTRVLNGALISTSCLNLFHLS